MTDIPLPTQRMIARIEGAIGWMIFNNPERRNAVSSDMWAAIPAIMDHFESDPAVRVIVLAGAGEKSFVAGADISEFEQKRSTPPKKARPASPLPTPRGWPVSAPQRPTGIFATAMSCCPRSPSAASSSSRRC